jgi:hypothetical protein
MRLIENLFKENHNLELIKKLRKDNKDINSKLDDLYNKSPLDSTRINDLESKIRKNREEIDKLIVKSLKDSVPESEIIPDEIEHMKILITGMEKHLNDINTYKSALNNDTIDTVVANIEKELLDIKNELNSIA